MIPSFVPGGVGPPELLILLILLIVLGVFLVIPVVLIVVLFKVVIGRRDDERITALEQRIDELEDGDS